MALFDIIAILLTITALMSYVNYRYIKLPATIGVLVASLLFSLLLVGTGLLVPSVHDTVRDLLRTIDFNKTLMEGMLSFLLFAGALHININDLSKQKLVVGSLATVGTLLSTVLIGFAMYGAFQLCGVHLSLLYCMIFGALISPTDPIAVLSVLKTANAPKSLETKIAGESLFNDGIGVVIFMVLLEMVGVGGHGATPGNAAWVENADGTLTHVQPAIAEAASGGISLGHIAELLAMEALGGALLGFVLGLITYKLLKSVDNYQVEIILTLALVVGGYSLAGALHTSGPIAIVVAGLLIGNHGRSYAMSSHVREHLDLFWELVDEILNAVLFVLIGMEVLVLVFSANLLVAALLAAPIVLLARFLSVAAMVTLLRRFHRFTPGVIRLLTWGGVRGGISVALALSLPVGPERDTLLTVTYLVVVCSILFQGLTIKKLLQAQMQKNAAAGWVPEEATEAHAHSHGTDHGHGKGHGKGHGHKKPH